MTMGTPTGYSDNLTGSAEVTAKPAHNRRNIYYEPACVPGVLASLIRVRDAIAEGFEARIGADNPIDYQQKVEHFFWPNPMDEAETAAATVWGELTEDDRSAVELTAIMTVRSRGDGAKWLFWRSEPRWESERLFAENKTRHHLYMSGSFVWEP